jgi:hypothetical protein
MPASAMGVSMVTLPPGIIVGLCGLALVLWGSNDAEARPDHTVDGAVLHLTDRAPADVPALTLGRQPNARVQRQTAHA